MVILTFYIVVIFSLLLSVNFIIGLFLLNDSIFDFLTYEVQAVLTFEFPIL